jgi:hypothetical protein
VLRLCLLRLAQVLLVQDLVQDLELRLLRLPGLDLRALLELRLLWVRWLAWQVLRLLLHRLVLLALSQILSCSGC